MLHSHITWIKLACGVHVHMLYCLLINIVFDDIVYSFCGLIMLICVGICILIMLIVLACGNVKIDPIMVPVRRIIIHRALQYNSISATSTILDNVENVISRELYAYGFQQHSNIVTIYVNNRWALHIKVKYTTPLFMEYIICNDEVASTWHYYLLFCSHYFIMNE